MVMALAPSLCAQDGLLGALAQNAGVAHSHLDFEQQLAAADFDNDQKPDGAVLLSAGVIDGKRAFRIELHVTAGKDDAIVFAAGEQSLWIAALDVNRDGAPDIVIEKPLTGERVQVYLNDGHGSFHLARGEFGTLPDPLAPLLRSCFMQVVPSSYFLTTRGFELAGLNGTFAVMSDQRSSLRSWPGELVVQSGARAHSQSRAPPSFCSL
jgi:hypothetical protein